MSETKQTNLQSWIIAGLVVVVAIYHFKASDNADKPIDPQPQPSQSVSKILDAAYKADRIDKLEILKGISSGNFANDKAKLEWINSESEKRRMQTFQAYTAIVAEAIESGKTDDLAAQLESGR